MTFRPDKHTSVASSCRVSSFKWHRRIQGPACSSFPDIALVSFTLPTSHALNPASLFLHLHSPMDCETLGGTHGP
jgi:hypothetical protein